MLSLRGTSVVGRNILQFQLDWSQKIETKMTVAKSVSAVILVIIGLMTTGCKSIDISESEQMALEISNDLLPPANLSAAIEEHLRAVRGLYPETKELTHRPKWIPGEILVVDLSKETLRNIDKSSYGPLVKVKKFNDQEPGDYLLGFGKPYNPKRLAMVLNRRFNVAKIETNGVLGDGNDVNMYNEFPTYYTYKFSKGWGDCPSGCIYRHFWEFRVAPSQETLTVTLDKEYGSDLKLQQKYN